MSKPMTSVMSKPMTSVTSDDIDMESSDLNSYVYILKDRTAIATNASVYKVGKTTQPNLDRFKSYPKGYKIYFLSICTNCHLIESEILNLFRSKYIQRIDYDTESFEGDFISMRDDVYEIIKRIDEL